MSKRRIRGHLSRDHGSRQSGTSAAEAEAGTGDADDRRATRDSPEALETGDGGLGAASALLPLGDQVDGVAFVKPETSGRGTDFRTGTEAAAYVLSSGWRTQSTEIALSLAMRKFTATGDSSLTSWLEARYIQLLRRGKCSLEGF